MGDKYHPAEFFNPALSYTFARKIKTLFVTGYSLYGFGDATTQLFSTL